MLLKGPAATDRRKLALLALILVLVLATGVLTMLTIRPAAQREYAALLEVGPHPATISPGSLSSFAAAAERIKPAVVNINTEAVIKAAWRERRPRRRPFDFGEQFGRLFPPLTQRVTSLGSGLIVDSSGYVLTNYHVVNQEGLTEIADSIKVRFHDGTMLRARVIGYDQPSDLAVLKVNAGWPLSVARIGDSRRVRTGDWALAVGSPFGLEQTVTAGIISATGRTFDNLSSYQHVPAAYPFNDYLQTDAAINRGNSGGPLVNLAGEVIGINSFISTSSPTGTSVGIGFAVPSHIFVEVYNQILSKGRVARGWLGVQMNLQDLNSTLAKFFGAKGKGVLISDLVDESGRPSSDGPAARAGIRPGDVIVEIDGKKIETRHDLSAVVAGTSPGTTVKIKVIRSGKERTFNVTLAERTEDRGKNRPIDLYRRERNREPNKEIGITVDNPSPQDTRRLGLSTTSGALVTEVKPGSLAEDAGLRPYDLIIEINGKLVSDARSFLDEIKRLRSGDDIVLKVLRPDRMLTSTVYFGLQKP